ncbi:D-alanine--D-alanine ligase [Georgenia sp. MJ206]|uniref:D-alanine--D-alanine ligase family protein n=1 Tax=Georgenia wangjunii TaxID=3117730 RepID=UPI002F2601B0
MSDEESTMTAGPATTTTGAAERPAGDLTVVVLAGGLSHERDVSLRSGRRVAEALRESGVTVHVHDVDTTMLPFLAEHRPDVVWPLLHGSTGEDGSLRAVLELLDLPYVGSDSAGSRIASRKPVAKSIVAGAGVLTPTSVALPQSLFRELGAQGVLDAVLASIGLPVVVKPADGGSALGVSYVARAEDLPEAMVTCFAYGDSALIERAVVGTEVAVSVIDLGDGPRALPPVEIVTEGPYDYDARYNAGRTQYFVPARLDDAQYRTVCETAMTAHRALGLRHLSRSDMILDEDGQAWFIDINVAPGMTETSLFPQSAQAEAADGGMSAVDLYLALVRAAARG